MLRTPFALMMTLLLVLMFGATAFAQESADFAAVQDGRVFLFEDGGAGQVVAEGAANGFDSVVPSPDGRYLAMTALDENFQTSLVVLDRETGETRTLANGLAGGYPVTFTPDSANIVYGLWDNGRQLDQEVGLNVYVTPLPSFSDPMMIPLMVGVGCGGGSPFPTDQQYTRETGGLGGYKLTLALTPFGLVYSADCSGTSTAVLDPATGDVERFENLGRVAVSPDGARMAGIIFERGMPNELAITLVELATRDVQSVPVNVTPDQLAWSADSASVYFSAQAFDTFLTFTEEEQARLNTYIGEGTQLVRYAASLHRLDPATGAETDLFSVPAHAIGRILPTADAIYVSLVPNIDAWAAAVASGAVDPFSEADAAEAAALTTVGLYRVALEGGEPQPVLENVNSAVIVGA